MSHESIRSDVRKLTRGGTDPAVHSRLDELSEQMARILTNQSLHKPEQVKSLGERMADESQGYFVEDAYYMGQQRQQWPNTYHPNNRNHPNLSWSNPNAGQYAPGHHPQQQQQFQGQRSAPPQPPQVHTDPTVISMLSKISEKLDKVEGEVTSLKAAVRSHEVQIGQLAGQTTKLPAGMLPANTVTPNANVNAISLRSGRVVDEPSLGNVEAPVANEEPVVIPVPIVTPPTKATIGRSDEDELRKAKEAEAELHARVPFPQRLRKVEDERSFKRFADTIRNLHVNIPFPEALAQMPKFARFLKDVISNKKKIDEFATVCMSEECSAVIQWSLPQKR
jgi:hypothetical protein